jgi:hypothetical protein
VFLVIQEQLPPGRVLGTCQQEVLVVQEPLPTRSLLRPGQQVVQEQLPIRRLYRPGQQVVLVVQE